MGTGNEYSFGLNVEPVIMEGRIVFDDELLGGQPEKSA